VLQPKQGVSLFIVEVCGSHTHTPGRTPLGERSAVAKAPNCTTHNKHKRRKFHAFTGIRARVSSDCRAVSDLILSANVLGDMQLLIIAVVMS
jgi:hypothetical protein